MRNDFVGGTGLDLSSGKPRRRGASSRGRRDQHRDARPAVERLEPRALFSAGALDTSFGTGGQVRTDLGNTVEAGLLVTQRDGKFLTVSYNSSNASSHEAHLLRYNQNGTLDSQFGTGGVVDIDPGLYSTIDSLAVAQDGKILVGLHDQNGARIFRLDAAGTRDASFGTAGEVNLGTSIFGVHLALAPDESIIVAEKKNSDPPGTAYPGGNVPYDLAVQHFRHDGAADLTFGVHGETDVQLGGIAEPSAVAVQRDGRIVVVGSLLHGALNNSPPSGFVTRFNPHGSLDTAHGAGGIFQSPDVLPASVALTRNGRIVIGGMAPVGGQVGVERLTSSLKLDKSFGSAGKTIVDLHARYTLSGEMAVQPDGKVVLAATIGDGTTPTTAALVRFDSNGRRDHAFGIAGVSRSILQGNGTITGIAIGGNRILVPATVQPDAAQSMFEVAVFAYKIR